MNLKNGDKIAKILLETIIKLMKKSIPPKKTTLLFEGIPHQNSILSKMVLYECGIIMMEMILSYNFLKNSIY